MLGLRNLFGMVIGLLLSSLIVSCSGSDSNNPQQICIPSCENKQCGDDGCGGSCGKCSEGTYCYEGKCIYNTCVPQCEGKTCGDDNCGGLCGTCSEGMYCQDFDCIEGECTPDCNDKECGFDGCNGTCGSCPDTHYCKDGKCLPKGCIPDCEGKNCGDDGCGGICGTCDENYYCQEWECVEGDCIPDCSNKDCGFDGCNGLCGECGQDEFCYNGVCQKKGCIPDCENKECGDDGCGGSCGECGYNTTCQNNKCIPTSQVASWTILVYLDADNDLEGAGIDDLYEMMKVGSTDKVNIIVLIDRIPDYSSDLLPGIGDFYDSRLLKINKGSVEVLGTWGEINMGDPNILANFIIFGIENFPAQHYMLDLWNHGGGQEGVIWDETSDSDNLPISELVLGISGGLLEVGIQKIDIIGFDACLMATYEVASAIAPFAEYMLASEEVEPGHGWDYSRLSILANNPNTDPITLGKVMIDGFVEQAITSKTDANITLSLIDLNEIDFITDAISELGSTLTLYMSPQIAVSISEARNNADEYGKNPKNPSNLIDIVDFCEKLEVSEEIATAKNQLKDAVLSAVIESKNGVMHQGSHGLSIYFPPKESKYDKGYDSIASAGSWRNIQKTFYQFIGKDKIPPTFMNEDHIADVEATSEEVIVKGQLDQKTVADVAKATFYFGIVDESTNSFIYLGDYPAEVDPNGLVIAQWEYIAAGIVQQDKKAYVYISLEILSDDKVYIIIPLGYAESWGENIQFATWEILYDLKSGQQLSSSFYLYEENGSVGALYPQPGSSFYAVYLVQTESGELVWQNGDVAFDATQPMNLDLMELPNGIKVFVFLTVEDAAGNSDYVYDIIQL